MTSNSVESPARLGQRFLLIGVQHWTTLPVIGRLVFTSRERCSNEAIESRTALWIVKIPAYN